MTFSKAGEYLAGFSADWSFEAELPITQRSALRNTMKNL